MYTYLCLISTYIHIYIYLHHKCLSVWPACCVLLFLHLSLVLDPCLHTDGQFRVRCAECVQSPSWQVRWGGGGTRRYEKGATTVRRPQVRRNNEAVCRFAHGARPHSRPPSTPCDLLGVPQYGPCISSSQRPCTATSTRISRPCASPAKWVDWLHTHTHIYMYLYIHKYDFAYPHVYMCIYIYICIYTYLNVYIYIYTYICTHIYIYMYVYKYMCMYVYISYLNTYLYVNSFIDVRV